MTQPKTALWTGDFILIIIINFFLFCSFQMHPVALPPYAKTLGAPDTILGWVTGIAIVSTLLIRPVAGLVLDRLGRRTFFLIGMVVMLLANIALYLLPVIAALLTVRFVHGLGWGVAGTASNTIAADYIPKERFGEGMAWFSLSASISLALAPALALSLKPGPMFITSAAFVTLAILLAIPLRYKKIARDPNAPKKRLNPYEKKAVPPAVLMGLVNLTYGALVTFLAVYAEARGIANIGPFFIVYAISMVLTRPKIGKLIDRYGLAAAILPGLALLCAAMVILAKATSLPPFLICAALYAVGQGAVHTSAQSLAVMSSPRDRIGAANATFFTGFDGGIGLGAVLSGVIATRYGYSNMYLLFALFPCLCAVLFVLVRRYRLRQGTAA